MEIFIMFFIAWFVSAMCNNLYMMFNEKPVTTENVLIVIMPILNTLFVLFLLLNGANIIKAFKGIVVIFKNIIKVFIEIYKNN